MQYFHDRVKMDSTSDVSYVQTWGQSIPIMQKQAPPHTASLIYKLKWWGTLQMKLPKNHGLLRLGKPSSVLWWWHSWPSTLLKSCGFTWNRMTPLLEQYYRQWEEPTARTRCDCSWVTQNQMLMQLWNRLLVEDGLLKRKYDSIKGQNSWTQLVVPQALYSRR